MDLTTVLLSVAVVSAAKQDRMRLEGLNGFGAHIPLNKCSRINVRGILEIDQILNHANNLYAFAYVLATSAASPAPIMESTRGGGRRPPPLWRRPKAASIMGAGEAANIAKT